MEKTYNNFTCNGRPVGPVKLIKRQYKNGTLAVEVMNYEDGYWDWFTVLTVNLQPYTGGDHQSGNRAFIDTNNNPRDEVIKFLTENGIAKPYNGIEVQLNFCTYPLYEFDLSKLREW